jgi:Alpha/beta hydrolase domain
MRLTRSVVWLGVLVLVGSAASCSSGSSGSSGSSTQVGARVSPTPGSTPIVAPLTGGRGINLVATRPALPSSVVESEYSVSGTAGSYHLVGALPADGKFALAPGEKATYKTRIVVRRPKSPADFNGTVVVEWLNVSGGLDAAPDYTYLENELVRGGYAWVGVSAQMIGVEGGPVAVMTPVSALGGAGKGLRALDPARYGSLHHPGDAYAYDIFTQVGRVLRQPGTVDPLGGLKPKVLLAAGESQSGFMLTTYADGVQPLEHEYDGFLIHSRGGTPAPLGAPGQGIGIAQALGGTPARIRTDLHAPVIMVETESDVIGLLGYLPASQPDTDRIRTWEVAGTSHVDEYQLGLVSAYFGCSTQVNAGPDHYAVSSALRHLAAWAKGGPPPAKAPRFESIAAHYVRNADGIIDGGIRTPLVDVPVDVLSGQAAPGGSIACVLAGSTVPLPASRIAQLYPSRTAYMTAFTKATDTAIAAGFVLPQDRAEMLAEAQPDRIATAS